jgi:hypothetical protein
MQGLVKKVSYSVALSTPSLVIEDNHVTCLCHGIGIMLSTACLAIQIIQEKRGAAMQVFRSIIWLVKGFTMHINI